MICRKVLKALTVFAFLHLFVLLCFGKYHLSSYSTSLAGLFCHKRAQNKARRGRGRGIDCEATARSKDHEMKSNLFLNQAIYSSLSDHRRRAHAEKGPPECVCLFSFITYMTSRLSFRLCHIGLINIFTKAVSHSPLASFKVPKLPGTETQTIHGPALR